MESLLVIQSLAMLVLCEGIYIPLKEKTKYVPDAKELNLKISRGSGTGVIPFGFAVVVLLAFAIFVVVMALIIFYKRERGIRNQEKTLFLTPY